MSSGSVPSDEIKDCFVCFALGDLVAALPRNVFICPPGAIVVSNGVRPKQERERLVIPKNIIKAVSFKQRAHNEHCCVELPTPRDRRTDNQALPGASEQAEKLIVNIC